MGKTIPAWAEALEEQDWHFLKRFLLSSGSLKAVAQDYGISYPTVRNRLDRLIGKVREADKPDVRDSFHRQLRMWVADGRLDAGMARALLAAHDVTLKEIREGREDERGGQG